MSSTNNYTPALPSQADTWPFSHSVYIPDPDEDIYDLFLGIQEEIDTLKAKGGQKSSNEVSLAVQGRELQNSLSSRETIMNTYPFSPQEADELIDPAHKAYAEAIFVAEPGHAIIPSTEHKPQVTELAVQAQIAATNEPAPGFEDIYKAVKQSDRYIPASPEVSQYAAAQGQQVTGAAERFGHVAATGTVDDLERVTVEAGRKMNLLEAYSVKIQRARGQCVGAPRGSVSLPQEWL